MDTYTSVGLDDTSVTVSRRTKLSTKTCFMVDDYEYFLLFQRRSPEEFKNKRLNESFIRKLCTEII